MTVYNQSLDEIKIILTHTEVIACFGSYEKLTLMGENIKSSLSLLISEVTKDKIKNPKDYEIKGQIIAKKNFGCKIVLKLSKIETLETLTAVYLFENSEKLISGIKILFANSTPLSDLYLMPDGYRLITRNFKLKFPAKEFELNFSNSPIHIAYTLEYGKPLILNNAVSKLRKTFIKDF